MTTTAHPRWKVRPHGSNWGDFGADDERGRLNLLTPQKVLEGLAEVVEGKTFCLSLPLDVPGPEGPLSHRRPPLLRPAMRNGKPLFNFAMESERPTSTDLISDDEVVLTLQYSTQWDGLSHFGQLFDVDGSGEPQPVYYNGFRANVHVGAACCEPHVGATRLGIEHMAASCVQGRAVMVDLEKHFGRVKHAVSHRELMDILAADAVQVRPGDMVCFYTGYGDVLLETYPGTDAGRLEQTPAIDGSDPALLQWITDSGIVALMCDNATVEFRQTHAVPPHRGSWLPLHEHCLFKLGIHLGEMFNLGELARWLRERGRSAFLLTAPPLRLPGAVGSPASPVATV
jgi:kynurenine formamidase